VSEQQLKQAALDRLRNVAAALAQWATSLVLNIGQTIVNLATTLLTLFFLLRDGEGIRDQIGAILPIEPRRYQELVATISASVTANVYGAAVGPDVFRSRIAGDREFRERRSPGTTAS
jgi:predicted PurR-regulated permease PerM